MWNLSKYLPSMNKCKLCHDRFWYGKVVHLDMKTADGQYKADICQSCDQALMYWREITEMRTKKED